MPIQLYEPQQQAVNKLARVLQKQTVAGNWSKTGTGKTIMNLSVAKQLDLKPLVVAPLAAHATWDRWAKELSVPLLGIVNPERLRTWKTKWVSARGKGKAKRIEWHLDPEKHLVIWDEMHRGLTGQNTITGRMAAMLRPQGIRVILTSATPFNSPLNARALGFLFRLHQWNTNSFFPWCRLHGCVPSRFHRGLEFPVGSKTAERHLSRINAKIRNACVTLTPKDLSEFFPDNCLVEPYLIQLNSREETEAKKIYREMDAELKKKTHRNPMVSMLRARQRCELLKLPVIAELVTDAIEEGNSVFVSLNFCDSVEMLVEYLEERAAMLTGRMTAEHRELSVDCFNQDKAKVLVASPAGGESISLHQHNKKMRPRTSLISPGYSASQLIQALGRIHRAGTVSPVVQRIVLCANTIEERVAKKLNAKINAIETLVDSDLE